MAQAKIRARRKPDRVEKIVHFLRQELKKVTEGARLIYINDIKRGARLRKVDDADVHEAVGRLRFRRLYVEVRGHDDYVHNEAYIVASR